MKDKDDLFDLSAADLSYLEENTLEGMTKERWVYLMMNDNEPLTKEEIKLGWHFCPEFDELLVGPGMGEMKICTCHIDWEKH